MTQYDPNDPNRIPPAQPAYTETVETVVVRESNTGWWIAGILAAAVVIAVIWILASGRDDGVSEAEAEARLAEAQAAQSQADVDRAVVQGQIAGSQQSVDLARADAVRAQADAVRAASEARAAEARAATPPAPVVLPAPASPDRPEPLVSRPTVTTTSPQP